MTTNGVAGSGAPLKPASLSPEDALFSPELLSALVNARQSNDTEESSATPLPPNWSVPERFTIRPLQRTDYDAGFLDVLASLTKVGQISKEQFEGRFQSMKNQGNYYVVVLEDKLAADRQSSVVACGTLLIEEKL